MANALWITLIGMGLVFAAIFALWGMMALIVWVAARFEKEEPEEAVASEPEAEAEVISEVFMQRKRRAAAAAVAIALAVHKPSQPGHASAQSPVSAWQSAHRASQLSQNNYSSRKKVVQ